MEWKKKLDHTLARKNGSPTQGTIFFYPRSTKVILLQIPPAHIGLEATNNQTNKHEATSSEQWQAHDTETVLLKLKRKWLTQGLVPDTMQNE